MGFSLPNFSLQDQSTCLCLEHFQHKLLLPLAGLLILNLHNKKALGLRAVRAVRAFRV